MDGIIDSTDMSLSKLQELVIEKPGVLQSMGLQRVGHKCATQLNLPFPSPVNHILSELSTVTHPSWVTLHGIAHSFIELDKAVVHVISLISFLLLWFSFCLPSDGEG